MEEKKEEYTYSLCDHYRDIPVADAVRVLKQRLGENANLMVGAGASLCALSDYFLDWAGLIQDMVVYLYEDELAKKGVQVQAIPGYYCRYDFISALTDEDVKKIIKGIIYREGVLTIPSLFAKRKGLRESIETYIEEHIPEINPFSGEIKIFDKKKIIDPKTETKFLSTMLNAGWNAVFTTNYDQLLYFASRHEGCRSGYEECSCAANLSLRQMRDKIIKLHGDLAYKNKEFRFDQDMHRRYILAQEDYDEYPEKHEAFMQLMKISLLKDCFCLVGFSGTDANFIEWVKWMRDVLETGERKSKVTADDIKIFFIDAFDNPLSKDMEQFFENYRIYHIKLPGNDLKSIIKEDSDNQNSNEYRRMLFDKFFTYLKSGEKPKHLFGDLSQDEVKTLVENEVSKQLATMESQIRDSVKAEEERKNEEIQNSLKANETYSLWAKAYELSGKMHDVVTVKPDAAIELLYARPYLRIVKGYYYQESFVDALCNKSNISRGEAEMAIMALEQMMLVTDEYDSLLDTLRKIITDVDDLARIDRLKYRPITFQHPLSKDKVVGNSDIAIYERCLRYAYTFEFKKLRERLESWNPEGVFKIKRAVLLSAISPNGASKFLTQSMLDSITPSIERYRATQLANAIISSGKEEFSTAEFKNLQYNGIHQLKEYFFNVALQPKERIVAYGNTEDKAEIDKVAALRCLNFMAEMPMMVQVRIYSMIKSTEWYNVAHTLFEDYPYPVLFYSVSMNDRNTLRRIGQDFAYSTKLHSLLPSLVKSMLRVLIDTDLQLFYWTRQNMCTLLSEIIKAVPPRHWQNQILQLWKTEYVPNFKDINRTNELYSLITSAILRITDREFMTTVASDCLRLVKETGDYDNVQNMLYYLHTPSGKNLQHRLKADIDAFIDKIDNEKDFALLANIHPALVGEQRKKIATKINKILAKDGIKGHSVNGLMYFAKVSKTAKATVKESLLKSNSLWNNGYMGDGRYSSADFIAITPHDSVLKWSKDEIHAIYQRMVTSANVVFETKITDLTFMLSNYEELLYEMIRFINLHMDEISAEEGFDDFYDRLQSKYRDMTAFVDIDISIYSEQEREFDACMKRLSMLMAIKGSEHFINYISILATRLLCHKTDNVLNTIDYLQYFVRNTIKTKEEAMMLPQLVRFLDSYTIETFRSMKQNVILCSELTILLAMWLSKVGSESPGIKYWMDLRNKQYFNWTICTRM